MTVCHTLLLWCFLPLVFLLVNLPIAPPIIYLTYAVQHLPAVETDPKTCSCCIFTFWRKHYLPSSTYMTYQAPMIGCTISVGMKISIPSREQSHFCSSGSQPHIPQVSNLQPRNHHLCSHYYGYAFRHSWKESLMSLLFKRRYNYIFRHSKVFGMKVSQPPNKLHLFVKLTSSGETSEWLCLLFHTTSVDYFPAAACPVVHSFLLNVLLAFVPVCHAQPVTTACV